ncbi:twin-arginine translocase subunit TatC [Gottfriedia luciferensis]|uniref:twin-arginine translocase subunit TatC n=1 Tax=Gottfriedia luciferensis TaxID=178774 RepID=UPI001F22A36D|nr:twin-arginine translocase subunit TatC [Gottfriedia luciferensis]
MNKDMAVVDHLEELRKRIIITAVTFIVLFIIGLVYVEPIYRFLTKDLTYKLVVLSPGDILWVYFSISAVFAAVFTIPVATWQIWMFVKPGLRPSEQKGIGFYIPALFLLFILGLVIGYYLVFPNILKFLTLMGLDMVTQHYTVEKYFSFIFNLVVPFAVFFDMPVVIMFLTKIGIVKPSYLQKVRKYAYFILVIVACCISPPDFVSHISVSIPLILLYELSVFTSKAVYRKKEVNE